MRNYTFSFSITVALMLAGNAQAAACREALRPLLLSQSPDAARLQQVRVFCTAEYESGDADAGYQLALLDLGLADWRPEQALPLIQDAAQSGVPEAQYWLAWQYESGPLLPDDERQALRWYQDAAALEHRLALQRLAEAYEQGELGLQPDVRRAAEYRAKAERCAKRDG